MHQGTLFVSFFFLSVCGTIVGESTPSMVPKNKTRRSHRFLYLLPVFMAVFFVSFPSFTYADPLVGDTLVWAFNCLLYAVYGVVSLTVIIGAVVMEYSLNPVAFSGLFNMQAVYDLWGMVRDFFNLFFILMILFIAFSTIFQVAAYNYKKLLWHLVLMALLTNFSFPVTRFLIDAANVPMYFFLESTANGDSDAAGKEISNELFSHAKMRSAILPEVDGWEDINHDQKLAGNLVRAIIFIFIFGISLLVLAVLLLLRTITLLVLVIFSPVGFAGAAIPWFSSYSKKWWDMLMSNAFFGPTAALMLLVSVRIVAAFSTSTSNTELQDIARNAELGFFNVADMAVFIIPVTLIWMSISVGKTFSITGAGAVIGKAEKFAKTFPKSAAKWSGRGVARGYGLGMRNLTTKKNKDGNIEARGWVQKAHLGGVAEGLSRKSFAKATIREKEREQWGFRKKRRELLAQMSEGDLLQELKNSQRGIPGMVGKVPGKAYGLDADVAQAIIKKGFHKKLDPDADGVITGADGKPVKNREVLQMIHKTLESVGDKDSLKSLESERADVMFESIRRKGKADGLSDEKIQEKVKGRVSQWIADGEHKKASNVNVMNEEFVNTMVDSLEVGPAMAKIAEMPSNVTRKAEQVAEAALKNASDDSGRITGDWGGTERWRKLGASVSSDAHKFFSMSFDGEGNLTSAIDHTLKSEAAEYANEMKSARIEKLKGSAAEAFAGVAGVGYFQNAGDAKLDAKTKEGIFKAGIGRTDDSRVENELRNSPKWKSFSSSGSGSSRSSSFSDRDYIS